MPERDPDEFNSRQWPLWGSARAERFAGSRRGRIRGVAAAACFLFFLGEPINIALNGGQGAVRGTAILLTTVGYAVAYLLVLWFGPDSSRRLRSGQVALLYLLGLSLAAILGHPQNLIYMTYAIAAGVMLLPLRISRALGLLVAVIQVVLSVLVNGSVDWSLSWVLVVTTFGMAAVFALINTVAQLRIARDEVAKLAVAEERSRVARDLHDVLGHSLTTITVKAGLARRLLEAAADRASAVREITEVEQLARQAMTEVRATVSGYRQASLPAEIAGARIALRAGGIAADLPHAVDDVLAPLQEPFAYVVREAVTNVLRHSRATWCQVRLGPTWLEVKDNGPAVEPAPGHHPTGHGLIGLTERLATVGGRLESGPGPDGDFMVRATVPQPPAASAAATGTSAEQAEPSVGWA